MTNLFSLAAAAVLAAAGPSPKDEALNAWQKILRQRPTYMRTSSDEEYPQLDLLIYDRFEFKRRGENMCFVVERDSTHEGKREKERSCWVVNDHYAFIVARGSETSRWMLKRIAMSDTEEYQSLVQRLRLHETFSGFRGLVVADALLPEIIANTECEFVEVDGDPQRYKVDFRRKGTEPFTTEHGLKIRPQRGTLVLNRDRDWVVESAMLIDDKGDEQTLVYRYDGESVFIPTEIVRTIDVGSASHRVLESGFDSRFSASDFRLTAFGLPEPAGVPSGAPRRVWFVGIASVFLVFLGFWLMRRRR